MESRACAPRAYDALAHAGRIDADHRRLFEDAHTGLLGEPRKAARIVERVQMKRLRIVHGMKVALRLQRRAHALDLPGLDVGAELFGEQLQAADQLVAAVGVGDLQYAVGQRHTRHAFRRRADMIDAQLGQPPQLAGIIEAATPDQIGDFATEARRHRAHVVAGRIPGDPPLLQHRHRRTEFGSLERHGEAGDPAADHAHVDIQVECQARPVLTFHSGRCEPPR